MLLDFRNNINGVNSIYVPHIVDDSLSHDVLESNKKLLSINNRRYLGNKYKLGEFIKRTIN